jgi:undecaprenyl-diphosphatase
VKSAGELLVAALGAVLVTWAAGTFITATPDVLAWDRSAIRWVAAQREPALTDAVRSLTLFGNSTVVITVLAAAALVTFLRTRRASWATFFFATATGTLVLDNFVKFLVQRPRPDFARITDVAGSSFPSGHSAMAAALFLSLAFGAMLWLKGRGSVVTWVLGALAAVLVAFSRVYLGAHWVSDVVGGLSLGAFWTGAMARVTGVWPLSPRRDIGGPAPPRTTA